MRALAISFVFFGDGAGASDNIIEMRHAFEAHAKLSQRRGTDIIAEHLANKTHNQHPMSDDASGADYFADFGIGMQRIEVARCTGIAHQLVRHR